MSVTLHFLGRPYAERDGVTIDLQAKVAALLGYLAYQEAPQPRERLVGLLWGESSEEAARKNLRNTLWSIRKSLGEEALVSSGSQLALGHAVTTDVGNLFRLARGQEAPAGQPISDGRALLDLYQGPFLDGLSLPDAAEFELWLTSARERTAQAFFSQVSAALESLGREGAWRESVELARGALLHDRLHEAVARALMEGLARTGEPAEALRQYELLKTALARELDVEPSRATTELRDAIAAGRFAAPPISAGTSLRPRRSTVVAQAEPEPPFVGRERECALLDQAFALVQQGRCLVALLTGELGIGKSRLWREWSARHAGECTALEARCVEAASRLPYAPLVTLFSNHACVQNLLRPASPLPAPWLAEVSRLLPQLRELVPALPVPAALPPEEERQRVFEAFVQVLLALDAHPLVVFVDDVQWVDRTTLEWLAYLVHRMNDQALLLVLAYRPEEAPSPLVHQVAAWAREGVLRRVPLARLAPEDTARLIGSLKVDAAQAHRLQAQSAGNPYFLLELSRSAEPTAGSSMPPALVDLLRSRLDRMTDDARSLLQAAAVLEPELDLSLLTATTGMSEDAALDALDELLAAGMLVERDGRFGFNHPLLTNVVRGGLNAARRSVMHRRAAVALEAAYPERLAVMAGLLASHYEEAGDLAKAVAYADLAADHALSLAAVTEAIAFCRRALALEPNAQRHLALGIALNRAGALGEAREAYGAALEAAEKAGDTATASRACLAMGESYLSVGWVDEVQRWVRRSLEHLDATADPEAHAHAHFLLGAGRLRAGGSCLEEAERELGEAVRLAEVHGIARVAVLARFEMGNARAERDDLAQALALYEETARLAKAARLPNHEMLALNNLAYHQMLAGELAAANTHIEEALGLAKQYGLQLSYEYLLSTKGEIALAEGRWGEAEEAFNESHALAASHQNVTHMAKCRANLGLAARGRGDLDSALILLEEAAELAAPLTARYMQAQIDLWLSEVYRARGERTAALEALDRAERRLAGSHYEALIERAGQLRNAIRAGEEG